MGKNSQDYDTTHCLGNIIILSYGVLVGLDQEMIVIQNQINIETGMVGSWEEVRGKGLGNQECHQSLPVDT